MTSITHHLRISSTNTIQISWKKSAATWLIERNIWNVQITAPSLTDKFPQNRLLTYCLLSLWKPPRHTEGSLRIRNQFNLFSHFDTIPACDGQMNRDMPYTALCMLHMCHAVKIRWDRMGITEAYSTAISLFPVNADITVCSNGLFGL